MIRSFGDATTEDVYNGKNSAKARRIPAALRPVVLRKLDQLEAAAALDDLRVPPGNRLEPLRGDPAGYHSIRINQQWRILFRWLDGGAEEVRIADYH